MDRPRLISRMTAAVGVIQIVRLIPEAIVVLPRSPNLVYYEMVFMDGLLGGLLWMAGRGLSRGKSWAASGAMAAWSAAFSNSLVLSYEMLHYINLDRTGPGRVEVFVLLARMVSYALLVLLAPYACWMLWTGRKDLNAMDPAFVFWILLGLGGGGGLAAVIVK